MYRHTPYFLTFCLNIVSSKPLSFSTYFICPLLILVHSTSVCHTKDNDWKLLMWCFAPPALALQTAGTRPARLFFELGVSFSLTYTVIRHKFARLRETINRHQQKQHHTLQRLPQLKVRRRLVSQQSFKRYIQYFKFDDRRRGDAIMLTGGKCVVAESSILVSTSSEISLRYSPDTA